MKPITLVRPARKDRRVAPVTRTRAPLQTEGSRPVSGYVELTDRQFAHALKMGAVIGVPIVYAVVVAFMTLAVPGNTALILAGLWPAIVGGPFFAGFAYVLVTEARCQPETSSAPVRRTSRAPRGRARMARPRLAH